MTKMASAQKHLQCVIVTPERAVLDETCDFVVLPLYDGELGVLPGRAPLIGRLGFGELRIRRGTDIKRYYVDGGFAQVRLDVVTVLTQKAIRAEDIDTSKATTTLQSPPTDGQAARQKVQDRARAQLRVARRGRGAAHIS
jgi:F-type H+-transporting ATPase subunit epsilon